MQRKPSKTQKRLEAIAKHRGGKIDLKKLWDEDVELDPRKIKPHKNADTKKA